MTDIRYINVAETAKLVRKRLKSEFPGVKFSVRSERFAGGTAINVTWMDGPVPKAVEAIVNEYQGARFDGSIDLGYTVTHFLLPDGTTEIADDPGSVGAGGGHRKEHNFKPHPDAERVSFGNCFTHCKRRHSAAITRRALHSIARKFGNGEFDPDTIEIEQFEDGGSHAVGSENIRIEAAGGEWLSTLLFRDLIRRTSANHIKAA